MLHQDVLNTDLELFSCKGSTFQGLLGPFRVCFRAVLFLKTSTEYCGDCFLCLWLYVRPHRLCQQIAMVIDHWRVGPFPHLREPLKFWKGKQSYLSLWYSIVLLFLGICNRMVFRFLIFNWGHHVVSQWSLWSVLCQQPILNMLSSEFLIPNKDYAYSLIAMY